MIAILLSENTTSASVDLSTRRVEAVQFSRTLRAIARLIDRLGVPPTHRLLINNVRYVTSFDDPLGSWRDGRVACNDVVTEQRTHPGLRPRLITFLQTLRDLDPLPTHLLVFLFAHGKNGFFATHAKDSMSVLELQLLLQYHRPPRSSLLLHYATCREHPPASQHIRSLVPAAAAREYKDVDDGRTIVFAAAPPGRVIPRCVADDGEPSILAATELLTEGESVHSVYLANDGRAVLLRARENWSRCETACALADIPELIPPPHPDRVSHAEDPFTDVRFV